LDDAERTRLISRLNEILDFFVENREKRKQKCIDILLFFLEKKAVSSQNGISGLEVVKNFSGKYPISTIYRILGILERYGFLDRRTKLEGFYLSASFIKRMERFRSIWRDILTQLEKI
jgi:DNA-binding PadR family transcriptional regulator